MFSSDEVYGCLGDGAEAEHASIPEPPCGRHWRYIGCPIGILGGDQDNWCTPVEDCWRYCGVLDCRLAVFDWSHDEWFAECGFQW